MAITPEEAARRIRALGKDFRRAITKPMNDVRKEASKEIRKNFKRLDPGRSIFGGKKTSGRPPLVVRGRAARLSRTEGAFVVTIFLEGMAALIEKGGRTSPHRIRPRGKKLKFDTPTGTVFTDKPVQHPGGRVNKNPIARRAIENAFRKLPQRIDRSLQDAVGKARL